jgi:2,3-bisphosphoglycerate-dependent phosphoglycerate mutase
MKLYILRHEDRTMDLTFFSPLTKNGLEKSVDLIKYLDKEQINVVYSSPYIRTLQTIYPYVKKQDLKIKLDYSIVELYQEGNIPSKSYQITLPEYLAELFNYDSEYTSMIIPTDIKFPELINSFGERIKQFIKNIIIANYKTDNNIVLVTHQGVIDIIIGIISKRNKEIGSTLYDLKYPKGALTKIFEDNKWNFTKINW